MAEPELVTYIRKNLKQFGPDALRGQLIKDGIDPDEVDTALAEATSPVRRPRSNLARVAVLGGTVLLVLAVLLSVKKPAGPSRDDDAVVEDSVMVPAAGDEDRVFRGHYGYILKLPPGYQAYATFRDPKKTEEVVYLYPKGTDPTHFIDEGLYGSMGILRLEVNRRRVPQGYVGVDTLKAFQTRKLDAEKATYQIRDLQVHGMQAFIVKAEKPFAYTKVFVVGQKVRYTLTGGEESDYLSDVLSSLLEVNPHDRPGR